MTSKIIVNNIGSDTGINTVTFDSNLQRGTSNLHSTGLNVSDTFLHSTGLNVGTGATIHQPADNVMTLGTNGSERLRITSTGFVGIGEDEPDSLLHIGKGTNADDGAVTLTIGGSSANTRQSTITKNNVGSSDRALEIRAATGSSNETIKFFSDNTTERLRIASSGQIGIAGANYGTAGQVLTSQGSGSAVQWASPTLPHAFVFMDSQYFTSSVTLLEFNNSTTNDRSSGVTITRGGSERFTPTVAGVYFVQAHLTYSHGGGTYTPVLYIYRNGSGYSSLSSNGIVNYGAGHNDSLSCQAMMTFNGTSDYVDMRASHNGGGNATMKSYSTFAMFRVGA